MNISIGRRPILFSLTVVTILPDSSNVAAQVGPGSAGVVVGSADFVKGTVTLRRDGGVLPATQGGLLQQGDSIETEVDSELHVKFGDGGYLAVRPSSLVRLDRYVAQGDVNDVAALTLLKGALRSVTGWIGKITSPQQYRIVAGTATLGVRGTDHEMIFVPEEAATVEAPAGLHDLVNEGATTLRTTQGQIVLTRGTSGYAPSNGDAPRMHQIAPGIFARQRTENENRIQRHGRQIRQHMEEGLRQRGKLQPGEDFPAFARRQRAAGAPPGSGPQPRSSTGAAQQQQRARSQSSPVQQAPLAERQAQQTAAKLARQQARDKLLEERKARRQIEAEARRRR